MVVTVVFGAGCGDDSSGTGGAGGSSSPGTGGSTPGWIVDSCGVCFTQQCAAEVDACDADPGCASTYSCLKACAADPADGPANEACAEACTVPDSSTALQAYEALDACRVSGSGVASCPSCRRVGGDNCAPKDDPPTNCALCAQRECCDTVSTLRADPEAVAFTDCISDSYDACDADPGCTEDFTEFGPRCAALHPDGVSEYGGNLACILTNCLGGDNCENPGDPVDPCLKCVGDNCGDARSACYVDSACFFYDQCMTPCYVPVYDEECNAACDAQYGTGAVELWDAWQTCTLTSCEAQCAPE